MNSNNQPGRPGRKSFPLPMYNAYTSYFVHFPGTSYACLRNFRLVRSNSGGDVGCYLARGKRAVFTTMSAQLNGDRRKSNNGVVSWASANVCGVGRRLQYGSFIFRDQCRLRLCKRIPNLMYFFFFTRIVEMHCTVATHVYLYTFGSENN